MKPLLASLAILAVMAGCAPLFQSPQSEGAQLTPWLTATSNAPTLTAASELPAPTPLPEPTPTPTIHIVALGETISSIALRYGLDMNAVLAANPEIDPRALIVGDQVLIPVGNVQSQIGVSAEPLALEVGNPDCSRTSEGGLWCAAILANPLDEAATNLAVTFIGASSTSGGNITKTVPALLNKLEPGDTIPAVIYISPPVSEGLEVTASVASAFPVNQSGKTFYPVDAGTPAVDITGRLAKVTGEVLIMTDAGKTVDVRVAAMAYDDQGNLVGVRRTESRVTLEDGKGLNFNLNVYSTGSSINSVVVKAEAILINQ